MDSPISVRRRSPMIELDTHGNIALRTNPREIPGTRSQALPIALLVLRSVPYNIKLGTAMGIDHSARGNCLCRARETPNNRKQQGQVTD